MDRKGIIVLLASFILLLLWFPLTNKLYPPIPAPETTNSLAEAAPGTSTSFSDSHTNSSTSSSASQAGVSESDIKPFPAADVPEKLLTLENEEFLVTITSQGGGIKQVELKEHLAKISCGDDAATTNNLITLNKSAALPVMAVLGDSSIQGNGVFELTRQGDTIRAEQVLSNGLQVVKEFSLASNHLIRASVKMLNQTDEAMVLPAQRWIAGTATPIGMEDETMHMGMYWYDGEEATHIDSGWFANRFLMCFPGTPRAQYTAGQTNVHWTSTHNQFFTLTVIPDEPAYQVTAIKTNLPPLTPEQIKSQRKAMAQPYGFLTSLDYGPTNLAPQGTYAREFQIYAGPKEYKTLSRMGDRMGNHLDLIMGYGGFFGFFAKVLLLSMNGLYNLGLSYALAIICITIIVKTLFWPLTTASTRSMKRMAALQPQMKALQEKYKEDPAKMNRKLMEFMKENKVSPLGGCLPMLLQIPVFFGFYKMILSATELRGAQFLWVCDLSKPDTIWVIPGLEFPLNPLPLLMGATMLWQARLTPPAPGMDPMQQKIMRYMPLMFLFILYNFSSGLTLYWTVQNILTIVQTKLTKAKEDPAPSAPAATPASKAPISFSKKKKKKK